MIPSGTEFESLSSSDLTECFDHSDHFEVWRNWISVVRRVTISAASVDDHGVRRWVGEETRVATSKVYDIFRFDQLPCDTWL